MPQEKMVVSFVEDESRTIQSVVETLKRTARFDVRVYRNYDEVNDDSMRNAHVFVLDVRMRNNSDADFVTFVQRVREWNKPFLVFTEKLPDDHITSLPGNVKLRPFVFENGGLGIIPKRPTPADVARLSHADLGFELIQRIMLLYWASRGWPR